MKTWCDYYGVAVHIFYTYLHRTIIQQRLSFTTAVIVFTYLARVDQNLLKHGYPFMQIFYPDLLTFVVVFSFIYSSSNEFIC